MEKEVWRSIPNTEERILVSNMGRVKSLLRNDRILKPTQDKKGYLRLRITLGIDRRKYSFKVHRLVANAFIPNPHNLPQVNHIDGDKTNNSVDNLEWVSNADNARHALKSGLWDNVLLASRRENESRKISIVAIDKDKDGGIMCFECISDAERYFNNKHISDVLNGKRKTASNHYFYRDGLKGGDI